MIETVHQIPDLADLADRARSVGLRHVHVLAWRDLVDVEAGGSELFVSSVIERWAGVGIDVFLRTSYAQGHRPRSERDGFRQLRRAGRNMVFPTTIIEEATRRHGPIDGMLEVWNGVPYLSPVWYRGPKIVLLHHIHRNMWQMVLESEKLARIGETLETRLAPLVYRRTEIITNSQSSKDEMVEILGFSPERITVAPPGIDPRYKPSGTASPHPLVVAVGRLMPSKRFDELIRVCAEVRTAVPDLELVIVSDGYERPNLEALIEDLGAGSWVTLAGRVSDELLLDYYRRAWVVASASMAEGWGMTLTEAAACGTPTVATRIPGHQDAVDEGRSGLLCDTSAEMTAALTAVLSDADLRNRLSSGALEHAQRFTWDACSARMLEVLVRDAERRRRRR